MTQSKLKYDGPIRFVYNLGTTTEHALALETVLMLQKIPTVQFISIEDPGTVMIGKQFQIQGKQKEPKIKLDLLKEDNITLRRQNTRGKVVLLQGNNELVISITVGNEYYDCKLTELLSMFNEAVQLGSERLGVGCYESKKSMGAEVAKNECFATVSPGDIVSQNGKIATASFNKYSDAYVENIVIKINSKSDVTKYLTEEVERFPSTSIEDQTGKNLGIYDVAEIYKDAFFSLFNMKEHHITFVEMVRVEDLIVNRFTTDKWNFKSWQV